MNYWREFSGRPNPVDGGPLSVAITVDRTERRGFDLSAAAYTVTVKAGAARTITAVRALDPQSAGGDRRPVGRPGRREDHQETDFFGPLVKNYVFNFVPDTTLASLNVNRQALTR